MCATPTHFHHQGNAKSAFYTFSPEGLDCHMKASLCGRNPAPTFVTCLWVGVECLLQLGTFLQSWQSLDASLLCQDCKRRTAKLRPGFGIQEIQEPSSPQASEQGGKENSALVL